MILKAQAMYNLSRISMLFFACIPRWTCCAPTAHNVLHDSLVQPCQVSAIIIPINQLWPWPWVAFLGWRDFTRCASHWSSQCTMITGSFERWHGRFCSPQQFSIAGTKFAFLFNAKTRYSHGVCIVQAMNTRYHTIQHESLTITHRDVSQSTPPQPRTRNTKIDNATAKLFYTSLSDSIYRYTTNGKINKKSISHLLGPRSRSLCDLDFPGLDSAIIPLTRFKLSHTKFHAQIGICLTFVFV
jgi:hypothetical protein